MRSRSAKNKGARLQNEVRDLLLESFPSLEPDDIKCAIMGESGEDIKLSPAARRAIPYSIECKNQEKISIWAALKQAEENCKVGTVPLLVFRRNNAETYATIKMSDFLKLIKPSSTTPDESVIAPESGDISEGFG